MSAMLHPKAQATLDRWHRMVAGADLSEVESLCAADAVFRSPVAFTPYCGSKMVAAFLQHTVQALGNFRYGGKGPRGWHEEAGLILNTVDASRET